MSDFPCPAGSSGATALFSKRPETRFSSKLPEVLSLEAGMRFALSTRAIGRILTAISAVATSTACCAEPAANLTRWRVAEADCEYRVDFQRRVADRGLEDVEALQLTAGNGTFIRVVTAIDPVRIVPELEITLPVRASREALQLLARVVLPRTRDSVTGGPVTILVGGTLYRDTGNWQRLHLRNIHQLCADQARVLRWSARGESSRSKIDVRESYIDLVVVNVYGGKGITSVWLGNPEIDGQTQQSRRPATTDVVSQSFRPVRRVAHDESTASAAPVARVTTDGNMLFIGKRPLFVRMIDHRGESFEFLRDLGFNTLRLSRTATASEVDSARRLGLWIVCPPPDLTRTTTTNYDRVLCWDLGDRLAARDLEDAARLASTLRHNELLPKLPLVAGVDTALHAFSRHADILLHSREPLGTEFDTRNFGRWLNERPRLARPSVLHWATIQTEPLLSLQRQWTAFGFPGVGSGLIEEPQLRQLAFLAVGAGMRGLHFRSRTQLDGPDARASARAAMLRLVNAELDLVEPWVAGGKAVGAADTGDPRVMAPILYNKRAQLLCVIDCQEQEQYVFLDGRKPMSVTVPGAPVANEVYLLTGIGLRLLDTQRVAGGLRIDIPDFHSPAIVLLSREPMVINSVSRRVQERAGQVAQLRFQVVADAAQRSAAIAQQLSLHGIKDEHAVDDLQRASAQLQQAQLLLQQRNTVAAERSAARARQSVSAAQHALWQRSIRSFPAPAASPLCTQFGTLPWHWHLARNLPSPRSAFNMLPNGDFEDAMQGPNGWQPWEHTPADVVADVSLTTDDARTGSRCLRLRAVGQTAAVGESVIESPLVWLTSPPMPVAAGQIVRIQGAIKIPTPVRGSADGVLIFDSLGGPELGYRMSHTAGWQPFVLYRATSQSEHITLTIALTGVGEALLDSITVSPLAAVRSANRGAGTHLTR